MVLTAYMTMDLNVLEVLNQVKSPTSAVYQEGIEHEKSLEILKSRSLVIVKGFLRVMMRLIVAIIVV